MDGGSGAGRGAWAIACRIGYCYWSGAHAQPRSPHSPQPTACLCTCTACCLGAPAAPRAATAALLLLICCALRLHAAQRPLLLYFRLTLARCWQHCWLLAALRLCFFLLQKSWIENVTLLLLLQGYVYVSTRSALSALSPAPALPCYHAMASAQIKLSTTMSPISRLMASAGALLPRGLAAVCCLGDAAARALPPRHSSSARRVACDRAATQHTAAGRACPRPYTPLSAHHHQPGSISYASGYLRDYEIETDTEHSENWKLEHAAL